ncbi:MAG: ABC transporter permease [Staphylothermus sp.]|nr:ABC transporter permease [Staphylothermus sp.]
MTPEQIAGPYKLMIRAFKLGRPIIEQYISFIGSFFTGDLGISIRFYPRTVMDLVFSSLPYTLALIIPATILAWIVGNYMGAVAAYKRGVLDKILTNLAIFMIHVPPYWFGFILIFFFVINNRIFPYGGAYSYGTTPSLTLDFIIDFLSHYTLPFLTVFFLQIFSWYLGMRFLAKYEMSSDYIQFSELMGVKDKILFKYVFRNSLLPQITGLAITLGFALGGQLIVENVFAYPGTGLIISMGIASLDYPLIQGAFAIIVASLFIANFLVDFIYALVDPRIRVGG